jgi:hypothetical protein
LRAITQCLVQRGDGRAHVQGIADLEAFRLHRGGQEAGDLALFQLLFAPQDIEPLAVLEQIDRRAVADDRHFVNDEIALVRQPRQRERGVAGDRFGVGHLDRDVEIAPHPAIGDPHLPIVKRRERTVAGQRGGQGNRMNPGGRRLIQRRFTGEGGLRQQRGRDCRNTCQIDSAHASLPPYQRACAIGGPASAC